IRGGVGSDKAAGIRGACRSSLSGNAEVGGTSGEVDREFTEVNAIHDRRQAVCSRVRPVVAELEFVQESRRQGGLETEHAVLRVIDKDNSPPGNSLGLVDIPVIAEVTDVDRVFVIQLVI